MDIYLDNIIFRLQSSGGISTYWYELLKRLPSKDARIRYLEKKGATGNICRKRLEIDSDIRSPITEGLPGSRYLPVYVGMREKSIFHSSYYRSAIDKNAANIVTVYDFTYEFYRRGMPRQIHSMQKRLAVRQAAGIICISANTKADLLRFYPDIYPDKVEVIPLAASKDYHVIKDIAVPMESELALALNRDYLLFVGDRTGYKNFKSAVDVVALFPEFSLVIVGGHKLSQEDRNYLDQRLACRYHHFPGLDASKLNILYNRAKCLLYPSSYEGFGIPIIEAMQAGCPVIAVNASSVPEVCGGAALLAAEPNPQTLAEKIEALKSTSLREDLVKLGLKQAALFSWDKTAAATFAFYQRMMN